METSGENGGGPRKGREREEGGGGGGLGGALFVPPLLKLLFLRIISPTPHNVLNSWQMCSSERLHNPRADAGSLRNQAGLCFFFLLSLQL